MCPTCEKYPERHGKKARDTPKLIFKALRWVAERQDLEFQGYCEHCHKEWRIIIDGHSLVMYPLDLYDPKKGIDSDRLQVEEHVRRFA